MKEDWQKNNTILTLKAQIQEKKNQQNIENLIKHNDFLHSIEFINSNKLSVRFFTILILLISKTARERIAKINNTKIQGDSRQTDCLPSAG